MSRLYDALEEARRFRKSTTGNAGEEVWAALGMNADPASSPVAAIDAKPAEASVREAVLEDSPSAPAPETQDGFPGSTGNIVLNPQARLIPNAVNPALVEHYRTLRTKIMQQQAEKPFRSLVVTSPNPQEGKSVTTLNLGISFSMLPSFRVLVVDGDLRRGTLENWLGTDDGKGLSNLLDGTAELEDVVLQSSKIPFQFVKRGNSQLPPAELLHSSRLSTQFRRMSEMFDLVLVDAPPVNLISDVQLLAANCDAVLLIARAFYTTRKALMKANQNLSTFRLIGTVLNAGSAQPSRQYRGYY